MTTLIPARFPRDINWMIQNGGESITYFPQAGGTVFNIKASVQTPADVGLVNDASQESLVVFISTKDVTTQPEQFDKIFTRGRERTIMSAHGIGASNKIFAWQCMVVG